MRGRQRQRGHLPAWVLPGAKLHPTGAGCPGRHAMGHRPASAGTEPAGASEPVPLTHLSGDPTIPLGQHSTPVCRDAERMPHSTQAGSPGVVLANSSQPSYSIDFALNEWLNY